MSFPESGRMQHRQPHAGSRRPWLAVSLLALALLLVLACGPQPAADAPVAGPHAVKQRLLQILQTHYLWSESLPAADVADYPTPQALLEDLTRSASGGLDHWSCLRPRTGTQGSSLSRLRRDSAFGFTPMLRGGKVWVAEVLPGSGAARAGLRRGDEVLNVCATLAGLDAAQAGAFGLSVLASRDWEPAQGRTLPLGSRLWFRLRRAGDEVFSVELAKAVTPRIPPVPDAAAPPILAAGGRRVGYLQLRGFEPCAEPQLRQAMGHFRRHLVTDLIVDLRYNLGGAETTLTLLANLLGAGVGDGQMMFSVQSNGRRPDQIVPFRPEPESIAPGRIAFIVTRNSASASEALINALVPYYRSNLALVGQRTHGKPVGGSFFELTPELELYLVTLSYANADGNRDYFGGLPDPGFQGASCAAEDDLGHAPGDPAEASTAAALRWILDGSSALGPIPGPGGPVPRLPEAVR